MDANKLTAAEHRALNNLADDRLDAERALDAQMLRLATGLPAACRRWPPSWAAYNRYIAAQNIGGIGSAADKLWRLLTERAPGTRVADIIDALDHPEATDEQLAAARPIAEAMPDLAAAACRTRGKQKAPTKLLISLRIDPAIIEHFKAAGHGWQGRINAAAILSRATMRTLDEVIADMPAEQRERIAVRTRELIAEEHARQRRRERRKKYRAATS